MLPSIQGERLLFFPNVGEPAGARAIVSWKISLLTAEQVSILERSDDVVHISLNCRIDIVGRGCFESTGPNDLILDQIVKSGFRRILLIPINSRRAVPPVPCSGDMPAKNTEPG